MMMLQVKLMKLMPVQGCLDPEAGRYLDCCQPLLRWLRLLVLAARLHLILTALAVTLWVQPVACWP
jgi:hypothetical protein